LEIYKFLSLLFDYFLHAGKHKKGNNIIDSNDIADGGGGGVGEMENPNKRKGEFVMSIVPFDCVSVSLL